MSRFRSLRSLVVVSWLLAGCGSAKVGEACDDVGQTDECEDGAICTNEAGGGTCRIICDDTPYCPASHSCNGVSGTNIKSCQPETVKK